MESLDPSVWGPVGALAVIYSLTELIKFLVTRQRRNGYHPFGTGDRHKIEGIHAKVSLDEWSPKLIQITKELRRLSDKCLELRMSHEAMVRRMEEHFSTMECTKRRGGLDD